MFSLKLGIVKMNFVFISWPLPGYFNDKENAKHADDQDLKESIMGKFLIQISYYTV